MNERIRKLYEQAHESKPVIVVDPVTCQPVHKIGNGGKPMYHRELNLEKFAELLVRECINVSEAHAKSLETQPSDSILEQYEDGIVNGIYEATAAIKEHFGVEE